MSKRPWLPLDELQHENPVEFRIASFVVPDCFRFAVIEHDRNHYVVRGRLLRGVVTPASRTYVAPGIGGALKFVKPDAWRPLRQWRETEAAA